MRSPNSALTPLFRSEQQLAILGYLFVVVDAPRSIKDISTATGVPASSTSREVRRLAEHDVLRTARRGTMQLVEANWDLPWAVDLQRLLAKTIGPLGVLADELADVADGLLGAWVYGSWAERFDGVPGPYPRDVDVLIVGDLAIGDAYALARRVERRLSGGVEVSPTVVDIDTWSQPAADPFLATLKARPMVAIPLGRRG